jgi:hypothetical protein
MNASDPYAPGHYQDQKTSCLKSVSVKDKSRDSATAITYLVLLCRIRTATFFFILFSLELSLLLHKFLDIVLRLP